MKVRPYWITEEIAIIPRPRGGNRLEDEMVALRKARIDVVVSMLETAEAEELGLAEEKEAAERAGLEFIRFAIRDRSLPSDVERFIDFLTELEKILASGLRIGIHCRACIGRSSVTAASLLVRSGVPAEQAWEQIGRARGAAVPDTAEQREWVDGNMRAQER